ncbi:TPA: phage tail protein [Enterobacter asburiae]
MAEKYYSILTNRGKELEAQSSATGKPVIIKDFVVGDGNGQAVKPDPALITLVHEVYRAAISALQVSPEQANQFIAQLVLPAGVGGFVVREVGLLTDAGELYAVANCAAIEKPVSGISVKLQFRLAVSETADIELKVATGDGLFLRQDANLGDVKDAAESRKNIGLKSAATADVQKNQDDTTPGRVLVNGGALAIRSVAAKAGKAIPDASALPANSVSFCYADAAYSPGYEATILDVGGLAGNYRVQYAASYADGGKHLKFRTLNGDNGNWGGWQEIYHTGNKPTAGDVGAVSAKGGDYNGNFRFTNVGTLPTERNAANLISAQPGGAGGIVSGAMFQWYDNSMAIGLTRGPSTDATGFAVWLNNAQLMTVSSSGVIGSAGNIVAAQGLYESGGAVRVYSSNNPPPQQDLSPYATQAWTVANFLQGGMRLASLGTANNGNNDNEFAYAPNGAVVTAVQQRTNYTAVQYRYVQYNIGGNWYTAWVA